MPEVRVDGASLFFREAGEGRPILLIHGAGPDSRGWAATFDDLATDHRVIAYDRRGYGRSADQPLVDWHGHAEDAATLLSELDAAPAVVVGWSGGGIVALDLAVHHLELVSAVVLAETALGGRRKVTPSLGLTFIRAQLQRARGRERRATETFLRWALDEKGAGCTLDRDDYPRDRLEAMLGNSRGIWNDLGSGDGSHLAAKELAALSCPVTCFRGDLSQSWFTKTTDAIPSFVPRAEVKLIRGTNHAFTFHKPAEFAQAIREVGAAAR